MRTPGQRSTAVSARVLACKSKSRLIVRGTKLAHDDAKMRRVEATKQRVSFADLQRMPEDGKRYELYDGELRVVPAPVPIHQLVAQRLGLAVEVEPPFVWFV